MDPNSASTFQTISNFLADIENQLKTVFSIPEIEKQIRQAQATLAGTFGATQKEIMGLRKELAIAAPEIVKLGGNFQDVVDLQKQVSVNLGTNTILAGETIQKLFAVQKAFNLTTEVMGSAVLDFEKIGISAGVLSTKFETAANQARRIGVNTSAVFSMISQNLDNLNKFGFQNGVEGLTRMAARAAAMRIDMKEIFYFAEKVYSPEGAIETVAALQRMGAAVGDLADPFRLMYMAQEDVEGLLTSITKMSSKFAYFDEQSKEFKIFPQAKRDLREISTALGISQSTLNEMIMSQAKLQKMGGEIRLQNVSEEDRLLIAGLANMRSDGKYQIKVEGQEKLVSELNSKDLELLKREPKTLEDLAREQLTAQQTLVNLFRASLMTRASLVVGGTIPDQFAQALKGAANVLSESTKPITSPKNIKSGLENQDLFFSQAKKIIEDLTSGTVTNAQALERTGKLIDKQLEGLAKLGNEFGKFEWNKELEKHMTSNNKLYTETKTLLNLLNISINDAKDFIFGPLHETMDELKKIKSTPDTKSLQEYLKKSTETPAAGISYYTPNQNVPSKFTTYTPPIDNTSETITNVSPLLVKNQLNIKDMTISQILPNILSEKIQQQMKPEPLVTNTQYVNNIPQRELPKREEVQTGNLNVKFDEVSGKISLMLTQQDGKETKIDDMTVSQIISNPLFKNNLKSMIEDSKPKKQYESVPSYA